ncbi:hypothetical protein LIN78_17685 [Leeia sp. TBRC 13508]|uniref:Uncharacterized protein n=1 Tax=Leeia speluncae TaxID=2884804 RepID=A0ABS8DB54_9NEIS|nr:hypothetical protein [Leeia speluncae]MCB6185382.1 hypothetical protein [Leeia speluncae]
MSQNEKRVPLIGRILAAIISLVLIVLGVSQYIGEFSAGVSTRFGFMPPQYGAGAKALGLIHVMLGLLPLIAFCKTPRQAVIYGSVIGVLTIAAIFYMVYK